MSKRKKIRVCITCFQDITCRNLNYCSKMCRHRRIDKRKDRRGRDTKEQKAKRSRKVYANFRATTEMIKEIQDEHSPISQALKRLGIDPRQGGQAFGRVDQD
jgi:hypothetical protein